MRVLHVSTGRTWRGGEHQNLLLTKGLRDLGVEQWLVAPRGSALAGRAAAEGLHVHAIPILNEADLGALARIIVLTRRHVPDVLHAHTSQAHGLGAAASRLVGQRRPAVVVTRRVEHSIFRHSFLKLDRLKYAPGADRVICVSARVRRVLEDDGIEPERMVVVPDGIDLGRFERAPLPREELRDEFGIPPGARLVGTVGHLDRAKGHLHLLDAVHALNVDGFFVHVLVAGDGAGRPRLHVRVSELGLALRAHLVGFRDDVPDVLRALDVFAFPSESEGLGSSVLEAMAARVPIVATKAGGIPEAVRDEEEALLVPPGDPAALAEAIRNVFEDPDAAAKRVESARDRVERMFTAERMVERTLKAYEHVVEERQEG